MKLQEIIDLAEVQRLEILPGDALAIFCPDRVSDEEAWRIRSRVRVALGPNIPVIFFPKGWTAAVVKQAEVSSDSRNAG